MRYFKLYAILVVILSNFMLPPPVWAQDEPMTDSSVIGDTNFDKILSAVDIQCFLLAVKNADSGTLPDCMGLTYEEADLNCDGKLNIVDAQIEIVMALKKPLHISIDTDKNGYPDCQEQKAVNCEFKWYKFASNDSYALYDIWGSTPDNIYAVGNYKGITSNLYPLLLHFDGQNWKEIMVDGMDITNAKYSSIWGTSAENIFIVGQIPSGTELRGLILHFDGFKWSKVEHDLPDLPYSSFFLQVWGNENNVFVGGYGNSFKGVVLNYEGTKFKTLKKGLPGLVLDIAGLSEGQLFAVLDGGIIYAFDDAGWKENKLPNAMKVNNIADVGNGKAIYAFNGEDLLEYDQIQKEWVVIDIPQVEGFIQQDIVGGSKENYYVVGRKLQPSPFANFFASNTFLLHFNKEEWLLQEFIDELEGQGMQSAWYFDNGALATTNLSGEIYLYDEICELIPVAKYR